MADPLADAVKQVEAAITAADVEAHRKLVKGTMQRLRAKRKARGLCIQCGRVKATSRCTSCRQVNGQRRALKRSA